MGLLERQLIRVIERVIPAKSRRQRKRLRRALKRELCLGQSRSVFSRGGYEPEYLGVTDRLQHVVIAGGSGTGKSVSLLGHGMYNIENGLGGADLDTHNTVQKLLNKIAKNVATGKLPRTVIKDIWLIDPAYRNWCVRLNPIDCPDPEFAPERVARLLRFLPAIWGEALGAQTQQLTQNLLILMAERRLPLNAVVELVQTPVKLRAHALKVKNRRAREYFLLQFLNWTRQRQAQVAEPLISRISALLSEPRIAAMLSSPDSDIDFRRAMDEGKLVLIALDRGQFFDSVNLLAAMILTSLQYAAFSRSDLPESERRPFFLAIEEFPSFAGGVTIEPFLNETRKFGVGLTLITQTFSALNRQLLCSVRSNCATQLLFRLSPEDAQLACSGLAGELKSFVAQQLVSLPTGTAILISKGMTPRLLKVDNIEVPTHLTEGEQQIIEEIRRNIGCPMSDIDRVSSSVDLSSGTDMVTGDKAAKARMVPAAKTVAGMNRAFVEVDDEQ